MVVRHTRSSVSAENGHSNRLKVTDPFHGELTITYELISPEVAEEWLRHHNERNRRRSKKHVNLLAQEMERGDWILGPDAITFDSNGQICNGQHRLTAVVTAGTSQRFLVIRGMAPASYDYIDMGKKRTPSDLLDRIGGYVSTSALGAGLRLMLVYRETGQFQENRHLSNSEIIQHLDNEPDLESAVQRSQQLRRDGLVSVPPSLITALYQIFREVAPDHVDPFMDKWATGIAITDRTDPVFALRRRLDDPAVTNKNQKAEAVIKAWNHYRRGTPVTSIKLTGKMPKPL